ncbi:hypothetical protein Q9L42_020130 (plasmid) [Methylomarinum sp. Ch1-1]|uniref:Uncharacterized protein n=1 Tax=Methylomarinum roseum TaxID=3067653 RepID=A0AAU7P093_9GAMM|nr:hypothetical protein [Methylomarinum sp. Ch1-1]MDP4523221.1 hypothetical protein [Methylomarinum sp. Ch1-1]
MKKRIDTSSLDGVIELPEPPQKKDCTRVTFKLPKASTKAMQEQMILNDYGFREKTKWIIEALELFLDNERTPYRKQMIIDCEGLRNKDSQHTILLPNDLWRRAWHESISAALFGANHEPPDYIDPSVPLVIMAAVIRRITVERLEFCTFSDSAT